MGERGRQQPASLLEQVEHLAAVDHARGRHRHRAGALDECGELVELVVDVHVGSVLQVGELAAAVLAAVGLSPAARRCSRRASDGVGDQTRHVATVRRTSLTRLEDRKLYSGFVDTNSVSMPVRR